MIIKEKVELKLGELKNNELLLTTHSKKNNENMVRSICMFGQLYPILIDKDNNILKGHSIYQAMVKLNYDKPIECLRLIGDDTELNSLRLTLTTMHYLSIGKYDKKEELLRSLIKKGINDIPCYNSDAIGVFKKTAEELGYEL